MKIAFIGGGPIARSVATLAKAAGHETTLGVRDPGSKSDAHEFDYGTFEGVIPGADIVVLAIPYYVLDKALPGFASALAGKILVDATNPVATDWSPILTGEQSSGAEHIAQMVPQATVVKAFNTIFADIVRPDRLDRGGHKITLFVAGDDADAVAKVSAFGASIGLEPVNAGPLKSARYLEGIAHLNIELAVGQGGGTNAAFVYDRAA